MRSIEGLDRHDRSGEYALLGYEEVLRHSCFLLRIDIEPVLRTVSLDIPVALRGHRPDSVHGKRAEPPAVGSGKLVRRAERGLTGSGQFHETAVLLIPDPVLSGHLVTNTEFHSREYLQTVLLPVLALYLFVEMALDREAVSCGLHL